MRVWMVLALLASLALSGCADDDEAGDDGDAMDDDAGEDMMGGMDGNGTGEVVQLTIRATGLYPANPALDPSQASVPAGATVELTYVNEDLNPVVVHDWFLQATGTQTDAIAAGETTTITFVAPSEPGEYPYWCAVGDHRSAGMEGVLIVA